MLGNYRVATQLVASQVVFNSIELVIHCTPVNLTRIDHNSLAAVLSMSSGPATASQKLNQSSYNPKLV
jgi:hypothetical protein